MFSDRLALVMVSGLLAPGSTQSVTKRCLGALAKYIRPSKKEGSDTLGQGPPWASLRGHFGSNRVPNWWVWVDDNQIFVRYFLAAPYIYIYIY